VFLPNCVCDFICVKAYGPGTEQAHFDSIKRVIHFHGKPHHPTRRPAYGDEAACLPDRSWPTSPDQ
jgi:hypothetical protein